MWISIVTRLRDGRFRVQISEGARYLSVLQYEILLTLVLFQTGKIVKFTLEPAMKAQRGSRIIALLFL
jgi:hypothetical protein